MVRNEHTAPTQTGGAPGGSSPSAPRQLAQIGHYQILGLLGRGGMGDVYLGVDEQLARRVAIKLLTRAEENRDLADQLQREAQAQARLAHPNVVAIHEVGECDGQVYLVMEHVEGVTLRTWLAEQRRSRDEILGVLLQAGRGLAAAHAAGLVHRDFKPENVMVGVDGRVRVMDFGLARTVNEPEILRTMPSVRLKLREGATTGGYGTPGYMAPEQAIGEPQDARCDIFSFCVVLFEALQGHRPFLDVGPLAIREAVLRGQIVQVSGRKLPRALARVIRRGLLGDPAQRWASMDELLAALAPPQRSRRSLGWLVLLATLVLTASVGLVALRQNLAQEQTERLAEERFAAAEVTMRNAEAEGAATVAAATFASFVADPAHRGTRALARAWHLHGDQRRAAGARDEALQAYARAYLEARDPGEAGTLLHVMAEMFRAQWDGPALVQALATLQARGLTGPADAALALDAALLQGDLLGAQVASERDDLPGARAWSGLFGDLARARDTGLTASRMVALPAGGPAALVAMDPSGEGAVLVDRALTPVGRLSAEGRRLSLVDGSSWVYAVADGQGELIDLAAPGAPLWRGPASPVYRARALDLDGDGARELLFGRVWPQLGFHVLTGIGGPTAHERVAHATTDASDSELSAVWADDLDGDGIREIVAAIGPWTAFDLRVFHTGVGGELELVGRRSFGRVTALTTLRRGGERLLVAINDEHCPNPELFPTPPHTGEPAGVHLLRWDGAALNEVDFLPLPRSTTGKPLLAGAVVLAADLDGDAVEELVVDLSHVGSGMTLLVRQGEDGLETRRLHGMRPLAAAQLDEDPAAELLVRTEQGGKVWMLGSGDTPLPVFQPAPVTHREAPSTLDDPLLVERWVRANELAGLGLLAPAAASLGEVAGFTTDLHARQGLLGQAATLLARAGDDDGVIALTSGAGSDPGPEVLAHSAAALARLGRHDAAHHAAVTLAAHPDASPAQLAEAAVLRGRLAPLLAPGARFDLDFLAPLTRVWTLNGPGSLRQEPGHSGLGLVLLSAEAPVAELPIAWDGGPIALEVELDLERLEYGACLRFGLLDDDGRVWLGAGVCGIGGAGQLVHVAGCKLAGPVWNEFSEERVASSAVARHLVFRVAAFPDGTTECSIDDGAQRRSLHRTDVVLPLPGRQRLGLGALTAIEEPTLARGTIRRITVHGARELAASEDNPSRAAARLLVDGEPAAALAALDEVVVNDPRDALLRMLAYNDLRESDGLARTAPELLPHLNDPHWRAELSLLLRTRPAAAMALQQAAQARLLPAQAIAWSVMTQLVRDPEIQRTALAELGGIDHVQPTTPEERAALGRLLAMRAGIREQLGHVEQARRDFEAALAVPASELAADVATRVHIHLRLARLLAGSDPLAARVHANAAVATSPTPELVLDRLAAIPGLRWAALR
jgi:predicted Ser/Thr protein kinase